MDSDRRTCDYLACYIRGLDKKAACKISETGLIEEINSRYAKCVSNGPFLAINGVFVLGAWLTSVYLGVHYLRESSVDKARLHEFAAYLNNGLVFLMAFAFASNIQKAMAASSRWSVIVATVRDLIVHLVVTAERHRTDAMGSGWKDTAFKISSLAITIAIGTKHTAVRHRQQTDSVAHTLSFGCLRPGPACDENNALTEFSEYELTAYRKRINVLYAEFMSGMNAKATEGHMRFVQSLMSRTIEAQQDLCSPHIPSMVLLVLYFLIFTAVTVISADSGTTFANGLVASLTSIGLMCLPFFVSAASVTTSYSLAISRQAKEDGIFFIGCDSLLRDLIEALPAIFSDSTTERSFATTRHASSNNPHGEDMMEEMDELLPEPTAARMTPFTVNL